jgi:AcrR family transcriptional regulator
MRIQVGIAASSEGRPYRSPRRDRAAADTRAAILSAATRLFVERGYGRVTVADIASEAGTAIPTVYASIGGKSAILAKLVHDAVRDPIVEESLRAVRASQSPQEVVAITAHATRMDNERYHDLIQVEVSAAAVDETAASTLRTSDRLYVHTLAKTAARLQELHALKEGLTRKKATDILWFYFGHRSWHLFFERRWSWDDAEQWLTEQASSALLDAGPARSRSS